MSGRLRTETQVDEDARGSKTSAPPLTPTSTRSCEHGGMQRSAQSHNKSGAQGLGELCAGLLEDARAGGTFTTTATTLQFH